MPRYIDADKLLKDMEFVTNDTTCPLHIAAEIDQTISLSPTADVVPGSEVDALEHEIDRLKYILRSYALQYGTVMGRQKVIDEIKREVAREIFEEIENSSSIIIAGIMHYVICEYELAELKKKYTEGVSHEDL